MIDNMPGFLGMKVLRCTEEQQPYLVLSFWTDEASFQAWVGSPQFHEGHKRAFEDLRACCVAHAAATGQGLGIWFS